MNFENWEYHKSKVPTDIVKRDMFFNELEKKFEQEILDNRNKYEEFFQGYNTDSVDLFIKAYAKHKRDNVASYEFQLQKLEDTKEMRYRERTGAHFEMIKQKKLFNMQLLWRAEKITIPEIRMTHDFTYWERHIDECPFLEPVTEAEVEVMKQFLLDNNYSDPNEAWLFSYQDYDEIMERNEDGDFDYMPEWYQFYDNRCGTGTLLLLPDIRSEKEDVYVEKYFAVKRKEEAENPPVRTPYIPPPPILSAFWENFEKFTEKYEDEYFKTLEKGYQTFFKEDKKSFDPVYNEDQIREALDLLEEADYPVIMPGGYDWREAIVRCANQYINKIIADELDIVFEEYCMFQSIGIGNKTLDYKKGYEKDGIISIWERNILGGRKLLGEPADFNF